ncbi:MAG: MoaD/ThiS family protein [Vicinamibacterales bacterium]
MFVTVKLFARLREIAGAGEMTLGLAEGAVVRDAWHALEGRHRGMAPFTSTISCAVNADYSRMTAPLKDGDEIAFLPPVSGG